MKTKLLRNFTLEDLQALEESLEEKREKVYIELPRVPRVSLKNYKALAKQIRETITDTGISPDTWEDFLDYFDLKLKAKGRYSETTLDKAIETYLRKRLGYKITDIWKEVIEAYKSITGKLLIPPPEIQNLLMKELEIEELSKLPDIEVILVEREPVKQKAVPEASDVKQGKRKRKRKKLQKVKLKPAEFRELIERLKKKSKKVYIFYVKDGRKITGIVVFYEKP